MTSGILCFSSLLPRRYRPPRNRVDLCAVLAPRSFARLPITKGRELLHDAAPRHSVVLLTASLDSNARRVVRQGRDVLAVLREARPRICSGLLPVMKLRGACILNGHLIDLRKLYVFRQTNCRQKLTAALI